MAEKQVPGDKKAIKWVLIWGVAIVFFSWGTTSLAFGEDPNFYWGVGVQTGLKYNSFGYDESGRLYLNFAWESGYNPPYDPIYVIKDVAFPGTAVETSWAIYARDVVQGNKPISFTASLNDEDFYVYKMGPWSQEWWYNEFNSGFDSFILYPRKLIFDDQASSIYNATGLTKTNIDSYYGADYLENNVQFSGMRILREAEGVVNDVDSWVLKVKIPFPYEAPTPKVFGISPESGSTITNLEDEFIVGWEGLPQGTNFIILNFINEATGITEGSGAFVIEETSGEKTFTFSDFNFEKNGLFRLFAGGGIKLGLIFLPVWIEVSPAYYINLNIEGYPGYFQMPNWLDWYHANAMFDEPTDIFSAIGGFMGPLYDKIGEFGDRAATFLNTDDAYNYGYNLGLVFPTLRHYVNAIEVFFGGFPIITIFLVVLILLLAIFIFRLILKFIPGMG